MSPTLRLPIAVLTLAAVAPLNTRAANLKSETLTEWEAYVKAAGERIQSRLASDHAFLWVDESKDRMAKVRKGEIVVSPAAPKIPKKVPSGLIHDWIGGAFLPNVTIADVLPVVRDYEHYKEFYHPNVIASRTVSLGDSEDRFSMMLVNKSFFEKTALDSEYRSSYTRVNERRLAGVSQTTRIQEVVQYGAAGQHTLPEDEGTGLIWRLFSASRFEERDGGVYIEVEAIALSRDIPAALRALAEPIVRRVSRDSLITALKQTETAVRAAVAENHNGAEASLGSSR
jgi:hypothetical protein